jgi:hypothetical protein
MTPKEKAKELYNKFYNTSSHPHHVESRKNNAKQCALIAVDEIINTHLLSEKNIFGIHPVDYWQEVKQEIEAL